MASGGQRVCKNDQLSTLTAFRQQIIPAVINRAAAENQTSATYQTKDHIERGRGTFGALQGQNMDR